MANDYAFVLLIGWIMNEIIGDQGGSNPLLELVLRNVLFHCFYFGYNQAFWLQFLKS